MPRYRFRVLRNLQQMAFVTVEGSNTVEALSIAKDAIELGKLDRIEPTMYLIGQQIDGLMLEIPSEVLPKGSHERARTEDCVWVIQSDGPAGIMYWDGGLQILTAWTKDLSKVIKLTKEMGERLMENKGFIETQSKLVIFPPLIQKIMGERPYRDGDA